MRTLGERMLIVGIKNIYGTNPDHLGEQHERGLEYFMQLDVSPYTGQWIGICDKKVASRSKSFEEAYREAKRACGNKRPFRALVPSDDIWIL